MRSDHPFINKERPAEKKT
jgi:hypothetical protein